MQAGLPVAPPCSATLPAEIDIVDCGLAREVAQGLEASATLRVVLDRMGALSSRVYIRTVVSVAPSGTRHLLGGLPHSVVMTGPYCLLHVTVLHGDGDRAVATIAHELQHAVEVLEHPEARTEAQIDRLFLRIGQQVGGGVVETRAAIAVEGTVIRELRRTSHSRGPR